MTINPPYSGTIYLDGNIVKGTDPSALLSTTDAGRGERVMYDRRIAGARNFDAYLFDAKFSDNMQIEIQVNPEFGSTEAAREQAQKYAPLIGQLPSVLRSRVRTVWIHKGKEPFGGGNNNLLIHTEQAAEYQARGILEETLIHEASHTSLEDHNFAAGWTEAQQADDAFISTYARDNPTREDVAESFLCYLAVRFRSDRISTKMCDTIRKTIPNRLAYFDKQHFGLYPFFPVPTSPAAAVVAQAFEAPDLNSPYLNAENAPLDNV